MRGRRFVVEFKILAKHPEQVLLKPHHQRVNPGVKKNIGAFKPHLGCVTRWKVLHVHGCGDHRARNAVSLGYVALHLGAQNELGVQLLNLLFNLEVVVGDQGFDVVERCSLSDIPGKLSAVGAQSHHMKAHLFVGHTCGRYGV